MKSELKENRLKNEDICICLAPTGMVPNKELTPHVPISATEIIDEVLAAAEVGISYVHLHARDADGAPTQATEKYAEIISGIRKYNTLLPICVSLSGRLTSDPEIRANPLRLENELKPDMGSLTLSSLNFISQASINSPDTIQFLASEMNRLGVKPELEVFDLGMVNYAKVLIKRGLLKAPFQFNILLGNIATAQLSPTELGAIISTLPENAQWTLAGIGDAQLSATAIAIALGAGIRIGLEDSIWYDTRRTKLATNLQLIKRAHFLMEIHEKSLLSPLNTRKRLGLSTNYGQYGVTAESDIERSRTNTEDHNTASKSCSTLTLSDNNGAYES